MTSCVVADTRTAGGHAEGVRRLRSCRRPRSTRRSSFVKKNPNTVQALTNAMVRALLWLQKATPDQVAATVPPDYLLGDRALYLASYNKVKDAFSPDGMFTQEGAENTLKFLAAFNPAVKPADDQARADVRQQLRRRRRWRSTRNSADGVDQFERAEPVATTLRLRRISAAGAAARTHHLHLRVARAAGRALHRGQGRDAHRRRRRIRLGGRADRLRQVHAAQRRRGLAATFVRRRARPRRAARRHQSPRRLHVPGRIADAVAQRARQRARRTGIRAASSAPRRSAAREDWLDARRPARIRDALSARALRRHAQARRAGADADPRSRRSC